jgi:glutamine cyclotransferase
VFNNQYFLEGSIIFNGIIYILTWRENVVFRFDLTSLKELEQLSWSKEGWGMTQNGTHIFISDGSNNIYIVDSNMSILATIIVFDKQDNPVYYLNELEWVC